MTNRKQCLDLTRIGKENRPKLEPRILIEDPKKSHHDAHRVADHDIFNSLLTRRDKLPPLKSVEKGGFAQNVFWPLPFTIRWSVD